MHSEKISEIIAHFIGLFDRHTDEIELRHRPMDGDFAQGSHQDTPSPDVPADPFSSDLTPADYDPGVKYIANAYQYDHLQARLYDQSFHDTLRKLSDLAQVDLPHYRFQTPDIPIIETPQRLHIYTGQGSQVSHVTQVNVVRDDDVLDMTNGHHPTVQNLSYIIDQLGEMTARAEALSPILLERTDSPDGLTKIGDDLHDYAKSVEQSGGTNIQEADGSHYVTLANHDLNDGIYVNGTQVASAPDIDDYMPDRGIATPQVEPVGTDAPAHLEGSSGNSLDIAAGANVVANIATVIDTGIVSPVMAVMGDYHSINSISQVYIYADHDKVEGVLNNDASSPDSAQTVGMNIAMYAHSQFDTGSSGQSVSDGGSATFPTAWHVSVIDGDVSFVHWTEQYNFLTDNDSMTVTTTGVETTVLTGGNAVVDLASYLGIGMQYDLVIIGGHVLDLNSISQISVLYDNDTVKMDGSAGDAHVQTGNNLIWNLASIENVGEDSRFAAMPDYMHDVVNNIQDHDSSIPDGLANDPNYAGYAGLNVLYITGNFYDVNVIKQVNVVGDADAVTKVANDVLHDNPDATVTVDTGSNAVVNIADIVDYDSFGHTTYVAGNVYSDAILIQAGLVDHDHPDNNQPTDKLANEAIAFLDDHDPQTGQTDTVNDIGHDMSWHNGNVSDVMQTVVA
jgi:hypothetical protein